MGQLGLGRLGPRQTLPVAAAIMEVTVPLAVSAPPPRRTSTTSSSTISSTSSHTVTPLALAMMALAGPFESDLLVLMILLVVARAARPGTTTSSTFACQCQCRHPPSRPASLSELSETAAAAVPLAVPLVVTAACRAALPVQWHWQNATGSACQWPS